MKKLTLLLITLIATVCLLQAQTAPATVENPNAPKANYNTLVYDFGEIEQGIPRDAEFVLSNGGREPLIIQSARASCGCTNLKYSQEPILPKQSTKITVTYNAAALNSFTKTITVTTNADPNPVVLKIQGKVVPKKS